LSLEKCLDPNKLNHNKKHTTDTLYVPKCKAVLNGMITHHT